MEFPIIINWTSPLPFKGLLGRYFLIYQSSNRIFFKQTVEILIRHRILWRLIWFCTVCLCPTKRTLGLNVLNSQGCKMSKLVTCPSCPKFSPRCCKFEKYNTNCHNFYSPCITFYSQMRAGEWNFTALTVADIFMNTY